MKIRKEQTSGSRFRAEGNLRLRHRLKNSPSDVGATATVSHSSAPSKSAMDREQEVREEAATANRPNEFWKRVISESRPPEPSPEEQRKQQEEAEDYAWRRLATQARTDLAVKEVARLTRVAEKQREEIKKLRGPDASQASILSMIIHIVKRTRRSKGIKSSQELIAFDVDRWIDKRGLELSQVCPERWRREKELPRLFSECLKHQDPKLRQLAKTLISRA
jgi:hypothetical protein